MAHQYSLFHCLLVLLVFTIISTNALQCHICGQFNDGVGSITPCLNYTKENAHLHLKECPRKTDKFCVVRTFPSEIKKFFQKALINIFNYNLFCCMYNGKLVLCSFSFSLIVKLWHFEALEWIKNWKFYFWLVLTPVRSSK